MVKYRLVIGANRPPQDGDAEIACKKPLQLTDKMLVGSPTKFWIDHGHWTLVIDNEGYGTAEENSRVGPWPVYFHLLED